MTRFISASSRLVRGHFGPPGTWKCLLLLTACLVGTYAFAHKPSDSYLRITSGHAGLTAQWDIALKDLEFLIGLDANQDSKITWRELKAGRQSITTHALCHLKLVADGEECNLRLANFMVSRHSDGAYAVLDLETDHRGNVAELRIDYDLLFDADPTHRGLVLFNSGETTSSHVLGPSSSTLLIRRGEFKWWQPLADYIREGIWHIWIGYDHILFLLSLLLPAVFIIQGRVWRPVVEFRPTCTAVLKIVTVFTVAHSITLWLAVMEYVTLPGRLVESTIALSIVITALNNLYPVLPISGWVFAFLFGLVHGFGFANVLVDLGLSHSTLAIALFGFNVGVELGQIAIVLAFLPIAFILRDTWFCRWIVFRTGSLLIATIAGLWMVERVFNMQVIS